MTQLTSIMDVGPSARSSLDRAWQWLAKHQDPTGCWEGEVAWSTMITAQYVIALRILGRAIDAQTREGIIRYFAGSRSPETGLGWGLHPESNAYVFGTTLVYVALRLLGVPADDTLVKQAREWLLAQPGGVASIPTWGKFWLSMVGIYEYEGMNPVPPEMFLLPHWFPAHPGRLYCHTRYIYLGIAYLFGKRLRVELPETADLRRELYPSYDAVDFRAHRHDLAPSDVYVRPSATLRGVFNLLAIFERVCPAALRERALKNCAWRIVVEQRASRHLGLSPVNGLLNALALGDLDHPDCQRSVEGLEHWRWQDKEGVRFAGARSNCWDTALALQAFTECPPAVAEHREALRRAYRFLRATQILDPLEGAREQGRDEIVGGWCFSDGQHRWPVSDCTAEAVCAILALHEHEGLIANADRVSERRLALAIDFILARQNRDGGFGTYERRRGGPLLERINPSEMFGQCMTERSYIECTASAVKALARYRRHCEDSRIGVAAAIQRGCRFLRSAQRPDGSYPGFWGINFTYANLFVAEALHEAGAGPDDAVLRRIAEWTLKRQLSDGSWGEHHASCRDGVYRAHPVGQAVMTAWALLALLRIAGPESAAVHNGVDWLRARQNGDGSWPREAVNGVFFGSAMLDYRLYRTYFPAWALCRYAGMLLGGEIER